MYERETFLPSLSLSFSRALCDSLCESTGRMENTESHCALLRVPGFPRGFKVRIARRFFGTCPRGKSSSVSVRERVSVCACVSRAIMPADVRLHIFLQRGDATEFRRSRRAEFMRPDHAVGHQVFHSGD